MKTGTKLVLLELVTGVLGWTWIGAGLVAAYFLVNALAFDGQWGHLIWAVVVSGVAKWLAWGFMENRQRIAQEAHLRSFTRRPGRVGHVTDSRG